MNSPFDNGHSAQLKSTLILRFIFAPACSKKPRTRSPVAGRGFLKVSTLHLSSGSSRLFGWRLVGQTVGNCDSVGRRNRRGKLFSASAPPVHRQPCFTCVCCLRTRMGHILVCASAVRPRLSWPHASDFCPPRLLSGSNKIGFFVWFWSYTLECT